MDIENIRKIIKLAKEEGVSLKYEDKSFKVAVDLNLPSAPQTTNFAPIVTMPNEVKKTTSAKSDSHKVSSPLVGTFYTCSAPGEPPFVKVGDRVSKGQVLCIVEAMKIMNEVESDKDGEITAIHVENEDLVEFGQELFSIK